MGEIHNLRVDTKDDLNARLPFATMEKIHQRIRKEDLNAADILKLNYKVDSLDKKVDKMAEKLDLQTALLQQILAASTHTPVQIDDNKKGEKNVKATTSTEAMLSTSTTPILQFFVSEGEQLKSMDTIAERLEFVSTSAQNTATTSISTVIRQILVPEIKLSSEVQHGEPSYLKEFQPLRMEDVISPLKKNEKNRMRYDFTSPIADKGKILGETIEGLKNTPNKERRARLAVIYRNVKKITVPYAHPQFHLAKMEEISKEAVDEDEKLNKLAEELMNELDEEMSEEETVKPHRQKSRAVKPKKKRTKAKARRKLVELEEEIQEGHTESAVTTQTTPIVDPSVNFYNEPIIPKDEPINFEDIQLPRPLVEQLEKRKRRSSRKKPVIISQVPQIAKKPEDKDAVLYVADIDEYTQLNLHLDEILEVKSL